MAGLRRQYLHVNQHAEPKYTEQLGISMLRTVAAKSPIRGDSSGLKPAVMRCVKFLPSFGGANIAASLRHGIHAAQLVIQKVDAP